MRASLRLLLLHQRVGGDAHIFFFLLLFVATLVFFAFPHVQVGTVIHVHTPRPTKEPSSFAGRRKIAPLAPVYHRLRPLTPICSHPRWWNTWSNVPGFVIAAVGLTLALRREAKAVDRATANGSADLSSSGGVGGCLHHTRQVGARLQR